MGKSTRTLIVSFIVLLQAIFTIDAKPNIQRLNPTGYSVEVAYDNAPFHICDGRSFALPKGLEVKVLATTGISGVYCQLPDGSRGFISDVYFGGNTVELSGTLYHDDRSIKVREGKYDILSIGTWKYDNQLHRYTHSIDEYKVKNQKTGQVISVPAGAAGAKLNSPHYLYLGNVPEETLRRDVLLLIKNPEDLRNLVGMSILEVEGYLGRSKSFVGDALTDVGYAYSVYRNVAYSDGDDKKYGLNVFYDKNSVCVDVEWNVIYTGELSEPQEYSVKLPKKPSGTESSVDCTTIMNTPAKKIPKYDISVVPVAYEHLDSLTLKNLTFARFARDLLVGENVLSALFTVLFLYGFFVVLYYFILKHVEIGSNTFHEMVITFVALFFMVSGVYGLWKFNFISFIIGSLFLITIISILYLWICGKISSQRCPYCHYFYGHHVNSIRKGSYEKQFYTAHEIRFKYTEIGELERLNDEQIRIFESIYRHEVKTSQYGKYEEHIICPRCIARWIATNDVFEGEQVDVIGHSKIVREEIWRVRRAD